MMTFALNRVVYFLGNILLAWAMLQHPYISKTLLAPPPQIKMTGCTQLFLNLNQKCN